MDMIDERALVYVAVLFVCSALAVFAGPARAAATFGIVTASIEGAYWLGSAIANRDIRVEQTAYGVKRESGYAH